jgi:histidinol dehydrogenase
VSGKRFMALSISPVENRRERENGVLVYPVYSRRSGGLSVGINLFPGKKSCNFDCPYCEVFPFTANAVFSCDQMEEDLREVIAGALKQNIPVRDICFSGNGEPTLSPAFPEALKRASRVRAETAPASVLVLITNGTGLLQPHIFSLLQDTAAALNIWLKLDAGTPCWYKKMNRCEIAFEKLIAKIKEFSAVAPVTIQTMLCAIDGESPPDEEAQVWEQLIVELAAGGKLRKVQIYGKARPAPEDPKTSSLPAEYLEERAESLRGKLHCIMRGKLRCNMRGMFAVLQNAPPVEVYL